MLLQNRRHAVAAQVIVHLRSLGQIRRQVESNGASLDNPHTQHAHLVDPQACRRGRIDRKSTRLNSSHSGESRMPSSA